MSDPNAVPPKEHQWPPGTSGNPNGRPPDPFKKYNKAHINAVLNEMLELTSEELHRIGEDEQESGLRRAIARSIRRCWSTGKFSELNEMLDRIIGKVPLKTELTGAEGEPLGPTSITLAPWPGNPPVLPLPAPAVTPPPATGTAPAQIPPAKA